MQSFQCGILDQTQMVCVCHVCNPMRANVVCALRVGFSIDKIRMVDNMGFHAKIRSTCSSMLDCILKSLRIPRVVPKLG